MTEQKGEYRVNEDRALVKRQESPLDIYGAADDIRGLAKRIKMCLPNGERLSENEALALAQLSVAYGLNPFNGETWYLPGKGTQVGIKGLRKAARKQAQYWVEHILLTPEERKDLRIPDSAIAYKALLYRSDMIMQSAQAIKMMYEAGMQDAANRYAYQPSVGIGYFTQGEQSKMKPDQAARKRAEAEALKVAFDLPFASEIGNGDRVGYVDAEDWEVLPARPVRKPEPAETDDHGVWADKAPGPGPQWVEFDESETKPAPPSVAGFIPAGTAAQQIVEKIVPKQAADRPKVARVVTGYWAVTAKALVDTEPYYAKDGQPDWFHLTAAAFKLGYPEITDANLQDVKAALQQYANDQKALAATEPLFPEVAA